MLSNSCRYGIRAVIYLASLPKESGKTGIKQIANNLNLPTPYLGKILQELAKKKILASSKGPHGGFSLLRDPRKITLLDIVNTIDGEDIFTKCIIHNGTCACVDKRKDSCPVHDDYTNIRSEIINLFNNQTIYNLVKKAGDTPAISI